MFLANRFATMIKKKLWKLYLRYQTCAVPSICKNENHPMKTQTLTLKKKRRCMNNPIIKLKQNLRDRKLIIQLWFPSGSANLSVPEKWLRRWCSGMEKIMRGGVLSFTIQLYPEQQLLSALYICIPRKISFEKLILLSFRNSIPS